MGWTDAIVATPITYEPARGDDAAALYPGAPAAFRDLVRGAAGCSSYLAGLLGREAEWLAGTLDQPLSVALADARALPPSDGIEALSAALRTAKRRTALLVALADLGGAAPLETVTGTLTELADAAVQAAISALVAAEVARGKLPDSEAPDGGLVALAMGKMGAGELNYSSDIDLIMLFDEAAYSEGDYRDARAALIRVNQKLVKLLSEVTDGGYVFRTDLRLRPDPSVTPVCIGIDAAEQYYESFGRTWERAALIKARPAAGDIAAGERFLEAVRPFIWRRHLDFAAIDDAHDIRLRIREHKGRPGPFRLDGHDVKLGQGGIREIEFFTQTRQLICGGRDPSLRQRGTLAALSALTEKGWVPAATCADLSGQYRALRLLEHRLQMLDDAQTHRLPTTPEGFVRLAAFMGQSDVAAFRTTLEERFAQVGALTEPFFDHSRPLTTVGSPEWGGFADPERAARIAESWHALPSMRSERARSIFLRIEPEIAERLARAADPDAALASFDAFMRGLPAGVQLFSLFQANPSLLDLLASICATAPSLARYLGRNAGVFDAVIGRGFYATAESASSLTRRMKAAIAAEADYESALDALRRIAKEQRFRLGVQLLSGVATVDETAAALSDLADATLGALYPAVVAEFATRHGKPPGRGAAILALGKLGSREMTTTSDLDLIVIYDSGKAEQSKGRRPLPVRQYYARLTQALVSALTAPTAEGDLYKVDMRLRPSGRQGPVAVALNGFRRYQLEEAWTWEHLALTRARVCGGVPAVGRQVAQVLAEVRAKPRDPVATAADLVDMRRRLAEANAKANADPWEVKLGSGRMLDVELLLQGGALLAPGVDAVSPRAMAPALAAAGWLAAEEAEILAAALTLYHVMQQVSRLATDTAFDPDTAGAGLTAFVLKLTEQPSVSALQAALAQAADGSAAVIDAVLARAAGR